MVPRSASEAILYDTLVDALQDAEASGAPSGPVSQFDISLAKRAPLRILIAEDNEINRRVALRTLAGFGYAADVAHDGAEAIELVQAHIYDLVLMDIQMPHVDGLEATRFIVRNLPPQRRPRVIAMSANVMREHVQEALAAGAAGYISKPFSPTDLRAALEQAAQRTPMALAPRTKDRRRHELLSVEKMQSFLETDPSGTFLNNLVETFAISSEQLLVRMRDAVRENDAAQMRAVLHEYCGMAGVIGAEQLMHVTQNLLENPRGTVTDDGLEKVEAAQSVALAALQEFLKKRTRSRQRR